MSEYETPEVMFDEDRKAAIAWAREVLADPKTVILDSETTGLYGAEFVEVAVIDTRGEALFDRRLKPTIPIEPGATAIHGIKEEDLAGELTFAEVYDELRDLLADKRVVVYSADFDGGIYHLEARNVDRAAGRDVLRDRYRAKGWECAMRRYAEFVGEFDDYYGSYTWQRLPGGDHTALGDARATLAVIRQMAGTK